MSKVLLLAATEKGAFIFHSDATRTRWQMEGPMLPGWKIIDLMIDQRSGKPRLFAAVGSWVYGPCIHVSEDLGKTWRQIENGPAYPENAPGKLEQIWRVVSGPADQPEVFYAGVAQAGLFVSRDHGENWENLAGLSNHLTREEWKPGLGGLCCHSILPGHGGKGRIYAGISAVGVFRSDDNGETWEVKNDGLEIVIEGQKHKNIGSCVHCMIADPTRPDRLYQQNHRGVFRSDDGAENWYRIENGLPSNFGFPMAANPADGDMLFVIPLQSDEFRMPANGQLTIYRTTDGGENWRGFSDGLPGQCYSGILRQALAVDGHSDGCGVYLGLTGGQIFYSLNEGEQWQQIPAILPRISGLKAAVLA